MKKGRAQSRRGGHGPDWKGVGQKGGGRRLKVNAGVMIADGLECLECYCRHNERGPTNS